jgi:hypothetical protein
LWSGVRDRPPRPTPTMGDLGEKLYPLTQKRRQKR